MKIYPYIFSLLACIGIALPGYSQVDRNETLIRSALHGLEYEIKAGFSIGGTAPLPLPVEIRSIDGYNPTLAISIGGEVTKWIAVQNKLGIIVISGLFKASIGLIIGVAVLIVLLMVWSRRLKKQSILIERRFFQNLRSRDVRAEYLGEKKPEYAGRLLSHDLHLADMEIPGESSWAGKTLMELNLGKKFGVHVASILRGKRRINIPGGSVRLFPMDKIQVIGTDEQLSVFNEAMQNGAKIDWEVYEKSEMALKQFIIDSDSVFLGKTIRESGIRDKYHCMIAGVESEDGTLMVPDVNAPLEEGDVVWVVGEKEDVYQLVDQKNEKVQAG